MNKRLSGFSLLEWLIASFLSVIIIAGLATIYSGIKKNYLQQQAVANLQKSARFALSFLNQKIRIAGYIGCQDKENPVTQDAIIGYDSNSVLPPVLQNQVISGTDSLVVTGCFSNTQLSQNTVVSSLAFFIGDTNRKDSHGKPILALFQKPLDNDRDELVTNVTQMSILYGVPLNSSDVLDYLSASQVMDWHKVRGIQIDLTILNRNWSTYIALRERLQ